MAGDAPSETRISDVDTATATERHAWIAVVAVSAAVTLWVLWACRIGIDFSDEGFYLNSISNPGIYSASHTQFGFVYQPLFRLVGGNIALLRQANVLMTLVLGWLLFVVLFHTRVPPAVVHPVPWTGLSVVLATSTMTLLYQWLPTPNYRSLALQALLLASIGILLADVTHSRRSVTGWVLLGVSWWLAFMAKPTTAAALVLTTGVYLLASAKIRIRLIALASTTAFVLLVLSAYWIDGSIAGFFWRLSLGAADVRLLQAGYTASDMVRLDVVSLGAKEKGALAASTLFIAVGTILSTASEKSTRTVMAVLVLATTLLSAWITLGPHPTAFVSSPLAPLQFLAFPVGAGLAILLVPRRDSFSVPSSTLSLFIWFLVCPYVFVFGTNNNYWIAMIGGGVFWVAAGVLLLVSFSPMPVRWRQLLPLAVVAQVGVSTILYASAQWPYRQSEPLFSQNTILRMSAARGELRVARDVARYAEALDYLARQNGFQTDDGMIDLTGHYPTAIYLLGARALGLAWTSGGWSGSADLLSSALDRVPQRELKAAWILMEPTGPRAIPAELLLRYGIDLANNYTVAGYINSPRGEFPSSYIQVLFKPVR